VNEETNHSGHHSVASAEKRLWQSLRDPAVLEDLRRLDGFDARTLEDTVAAGMPSHWALDTSLAELASLVEHPGVKRALAHYLSTRLHRDVPRLVDAGAVSEQDADEWLSDGSIGQPRRWTALRAADLLDEAATLDDQAGAAKSDEERRSCLLLRDFCRSAAQDGFHLDPGANRCETAFALGLAWGMAQAPENSLLYQDGAIERHRAILSAASGREASAPVLFGDFPGLCSICGRPYDRDREDNGLTCDVRGCHVVIVSDEVEKELDANGGYSVTLAHELIHTLQMQSDGKFMRGVDLQVDAEEDMAHAALTELLVEGGAEAGAMVLLRDLADTTAFNSNTPQDEAAFVFALAAVASAHDQERMREMVSEIAFAGQNTASSVATRILFGVDTPEHQDALARVASAYNEFACDQFVHDGADARSFGTLLQEASRALETALAAAATGAPERAPDPDPDSVAATLAE
jgi:hypothetical protein